MYWFAATHQASKVKIPAIFSIKTARRLSVNEANPDTENATNLNYFNVGVNNK